MNLLDAFHRQVTDHPDRIALVDPAGRRWSYRRLDQRSRDLAAAFAARGLGRGDRVLLALGVDADLYAALAALWRLGAVAVLPEPALGIAGLRHAMAALQPEALLLGGGYRWLPLLVGAMRRVRMRLPLRPGKGAVPPVADLPADAPALISFTTGSTGLPKAIVRSHGFMQAQDAAVAPLIGTAGRHETDLVGFPVFVVANLGQGITSVLPDWPAKRMGRATGARMARLIEREGVTRLLVNPALAERLARHGIPARVQDLFTGGGPVFPDLLRRIMAARPDLRIVSVYGSTEAEPIAEIDSRDISAADFEAMAAGAGLLAGFPVEAARVRIVDDEIQVSGDHVVGGYLDPARDAETKVRTADGTLWHRTGDAGRFDERGRLWLLGRLGSRVGAIWPFPVEVAARHWPGVERAALVPWQGEAALAIEGEADHTDDWRRRAAEIDVRRVFRLSRMPMDRRHGSKIDHKQLMGRLPR